MNMWRTSLCRSLAALVLLLNGPVRAGASLPVAASSADPAIPLMVLTYHDVTPTADRGQDPDAITPDTLISQLEWLRGHGWTFVSWAQVQAARAHRQSLPPRAVMLTFDDGLASVYTQVFPLLQAYRAPAAIALVRAWMDLPPHAPLPYNGQACDQACFVTWDQVRTMEKSGLVTVMSHSANLHHGIVANAEGNTEPSAITWEIVNGHRETPEAHRARIQADLAASQAGFQKELGHRVSGIVWPYGAYNAEDVTLAQEQGMTSLGLSANGPVSVEGPVLERWLVGHDVKLGDWVDHVAPQPPAAQRAIAVSLRDLDGPTAATQESRLGRLIDRASALQVGEVWFTDPWAVTGDRWDRWNRDVWQLHTRAGAQGVMVWPADRPLNLREVADLARQAAIAALVIPGTASLQEQAAVQTVLKQWRSGAELRVLDPQHGLAPDVVAVQSAPLASFDPTAFLWVPTQPTPEAAVQALHHALATGHNRLVYASPDWLAPSDAWRRYKPGVSLSSFPYRRP
jgi:poly-beta-1,6-N-acetyl-D-glucosamine N-deacetylase